MSQLLRETMEQGKGALASSLNDQNWLSVRTSVVESGESASTIHSLLQQVRGWSLQARLRQQKRMM